MLPLRDINPSRRFPIVTVTIIVINVIAFIFELALGYERVIGTYGAIPLEVITGKDLPPYYTNIPVILTPITAMFLHGGFFHLFFNMLYLWIFGDNVEDAFGHFGFLLFYLASGIGAFIIHTVVYMIFRPSELTVPTIGASGAISGVLAAYMLLYPHARVLTLISFGWFIDFIEVPAGFLIGFWFLTQILNGFFGLFWSSSVAWFAHIGGFLVGLILTWLTLKRRAKKFVDEYVPEFAIDDEYEVYW